MKSGKSKNSAKRKKQYNQLKQNKNFGRNRKGGMEMNLVTGLEI